MHLPKSIVIFTTTIAAISLSACTTKTHSRSACASEIDSAWQQMDIAKADGFGGTVSYAKASSLLTAARTMQTVGNFHNCSRHAKDAHFYIRESRKGH